MMFVFNLSEEYRLPAEWNDIMIKLIFFSLTFWKQGWYKADEAQKMETFIQSTYPLILEFFTPIKFLVLSATLLEVLTNGMNN